VDVGEYVFLAVFGVEMLMKIVAMGFVYGENSYLRDAWNRLDFAVVILGVMSTLNLGNFSALRTVRVLRPLRSITIIPSMRNLVVTLLKSMPLLLDVCVLVGFLFFLFGLVGVQLFAGTLDYRCATLDNPNAGCSLCGTRGDATVFAGCDDGCALPSSPRWTVDDDLVCGGPRVSAYPERGGTAAGFMCPEGSYCLEQDSPNFGITNFDHILYAWLTIFQCISLEGWTDVMYYLQAAVSPWVWIYFVILIVLGSFFAVNLALAVLYVAFVTEREDNEEREERAEEAAEQKRKDAGEGPPPREPTDLKVKYSSEHEFQKATLLEIDDMIAQARGGGGASGGGTPGRGGGDKRASPSAGNQMSRAFIDGGTTGTQAVATGSAKVMPLMPMITEGASDPSAPWVAAGFDNVHAWCDANDAEIEDVQLVEGRIVIVPPTRYRKFQRKCRRLAVSHAFATVTMIIILVNTCLMASEFYGQPGDMTTAYEIINYLFTAYFVGEMFIKVVGLTPRGYVADRFNVFDGTVVIISIIEIAASSGSGGSLSVLRSARLLRILKLARSWPQLRNIIETIMESLPSMSSLSGILALFIFVFDLLGMQIFGFEFQFCDSYGVDDAAPTCPITLGKSCPDYYDCYVACTAAQANAWVKFPSGAQGPCASYGADGHLVRLGECDVPRHNFDTFYWAFVTIFQVLTGENWNTVMYDGMRSTDSAAVLYFLALTIFGNYVVLNLFLAILLDNFSGIGDKEEAEKEARAKRKEEEAAAEKERLYQRNRNPQLHSRSDPGGSPLERVDSDASSGSTNSSSRSRSSRFRSFREWKESLERKWDSAMEWYGSKREKVIPKKGTRAHELHARLHFVVTHKYFENTIIFLIVLSSALLAVDSPKVTSGSQLEAWLEALDIVFVTIFLLEAILKIIALGDTYFKSNWNKLDFGIVIIGLISLILTQTKSGDGKSAAGIRALRAFRALRPLRVAARNEGMKVVVAALFQAVPAIANVALVCLVFYLIFGILGLNLFIGKLHRCEEINTDTAVTPALIGVDDSRLTREWCKASWHVHGCLSDSRANFYSSGDSGVGWTCVETTPATSYINAAENREEKYGNVWTCTASSDTKAVLSGGYGVRGYNSPASAISTKGVVGFAPDASSTTALHAVITSGTFTSLCEPTFMDTVWKNPDSYSYDNIGASMLALFEIATLEMWLDIMYHSVDAVDEDHHPRTNYNEPAALFYVVFIIVGSFFVMNLFVGVTIDKFNEMKEENEKKGKGPGATLFVTEEQRKWQRVEKMMAGIKPKKFYDIPANRFRKAAYGIVTHDKFDLVVMGLIAANIVVMSMNHADETEEYSKGLFWTNFCFTVVFFLEICLKVMGMGFKAYITEKWNRFDFVVVAISIIGFVITMSSDVKTSYLSLLRVFRIARVLRLIKRAKGLRALLQTLIFSLPALVNVGSVLFLFFFIFAVMGMNLFGYIKRQEFITNFANFEDFPNSMLLLFRMSTGESWNGIMHDCMIEDLCVEILTGSDAGTYYDSGDSRLSSMTANTDYVDRCTPSPELTIFFFLLFILMCAFVMLNLVIAVILDNFESYSQKEELPVSEEDLASFSAAWGKFDRGHTYYMAMSELPDLMKELKRPLGVADVTPLSQQKKALKNKLLSTHVKNFQGRIHFVDTIQALAARVDGIDRPKPKGLKEPNLQEWKFGKKNDESDPFKSFDLFSSHYYAAMMFQAVWRGFIARKKANVRRMKAVSVPKKKTSGGGRFNIFKKKDGKSSKNKSNLGVDSGGSGSGDGSGSNTPNATPSAIVLDADDDAELDALQREAKAQIEALKKLSEGEGGSGSGLASAGDSPSAPAGDSEIQETTTAAEPKALTIEEERAIALVKEQEELTKKEDMEQAQFKAKIFIGGIGKAAADKNEMRQALAQAASPDPDEPKPEEREVRHHRPRMRMMM
jgi:hypothetical protein